MTKPDMQAELDKLRAENTALRDLLAAVQETADAGQAVNGPSGHMYFQPGARAALRISIWLEDADGFDAGHAAQIAADFRGHVGEITALGTSAAA